MDKALRSYFHGAANNPVLLSRSYVLLFLILVLSLPHSVSAYRGMQHLTTNDGLSGNTVHTALQDNNGYIWFGTSAGVSRFDGSRFRRYTTIDGLGGNEVFHIFLDSHGRLWFLTFNGIVSFYENGRFYNPGNSDLLSGVNFTNMLTFIFEDDDGLIWIGALDGTIHVIGENGLIKSTQLDISAVRQGWITSEGETRFGTGDGTYSYDLATASWMKVDDKLYRYVQQSRTAEGGYSIPFVGGARLTRPDVDFIIPAETPVLSATAPTCATLSRTGVWLAIGTIDDGLLIYDIRDTENPVLGAHLLSGHTITSAYFDTQNSLWITTLNNGVYRVTESYEFIQIPYANGKQIGDIIRSGISDSNGNVWIGSLSGRVYRFSKGINNADVLDLVDLNPPSGSIETITETPDGRIMFGAGHRVLVLENPADAPESWQVSDLKLHRPTLTTTFKSLSVYDGYLYAGTNLNLLRYDLKSPGDFEILSDSRISSMYLLPDGELLVGTLNGLQRFDTKNNVMYSFEDRVISDSQIYSMTILTDEMLAIATYGQGLIVLNTKNYSSTQITEEDGLTDNLIRSITTDETSSLWVASSVGLDRIKIESLVPDADGRARPLIYRYSENFRGFKANTIVSNYGQVWLGGVQGLYTLNAIYPGLPDIHVPMLIEEVIINDNSITSLSESFTVAHVQNKWTFRFTGILFRDPNRLQYSYRLRPKYDQQTPWSRTTANELQFESLSPGNYVFEVKATSSDGKISSDTASVQFIIKHAVWQLWWVQLGSFFVLVSIVGAFVKFRLDQLQRQRNEQNSLKDRINSLEHQALQAMMSPHFVFNIINNIRHKILTEDKDQASALLVSFSRLIRMQLDTSYRKQVTLEEEFDRLQLYVSLVSARINKEITFSYTIEEGINASMSRIPAMLLQPLIENALIYGIVPKDTGGHIQIDIRRNEAEQLYIQITDNGDGLKPENASDSPEFKRLSLGTTLVRERLELMSRENQLPWKLDIRNNYDESDQISGVTSEILLPLK